MLVIAVAALRMRARSLLVLAQQGLQRIERAESEWIQPSNSEGKHLVLIELGVCNEVVGLSHALKIPLPTLLEVLLPLHVCLVDRNHQRVEDGLLLVAQHLLELFVRDVLVVARLLHLHTSHRLESLQVQLLLIRGKSLCRHLVEHLQIIVYVRLGVRVLLLACLVFFFLAADFLGHWWLLAALLL